MYRQQINYKQDDYINILHIGLYTFSMIFKFLQPEHSTDFYFKGYFNLNEKSFL